MFTRAPESLPWTFEMADSHSAIPPWANPTTNQVPC
jgi:hypothetical protein